MSEQSGYIVLLKLARKTRLASLIPRHKMASTSNIPLSELGPILTAAGNQMYVNYPII